MRFPCPSKTAWALLVAFLVLLTLLWFSQDKLDVRVVFAGYTNAAVSKTWVAVLVINNSATKGNITIWPDVCLDFRTRLA